MSEEDVEFAKALINERIQWFNDKELYYRANPDKWNEEAALDVCDMAKDTLEKILMEDSLLKLLRLAELGAAMKDRIAQRRYSEELEHVLDKLDRR
jgi:hypothetical protein